MTRVAFQTSYEISPIILVNGIAAQSSGQMMPLLSILQPGSSNANGGPFSGPFGSIVNQATSDAIQYINSQVGRLLPGVALLDPQQFFGHFRPLPGSTLIENEIADYPFANQTVAANAIIARPLRLSMVMDCPASGAGAYAQKQAIMSALKAALDGHNLAGGSYTIATPSYIYSNCLLRSLTDVSSGESKQVQTSWQFDFERPLLTVSEAVQAYNSTLNKIAGGLPIIGQPTWSGAISTINSSITGALAPLQTAVSAVKNASAFASAIGNPTAVVTSAIGNQARSAFASVTRGLF